MGSFVLGAWMLAGAIFFAIDHGIEVKAARALTEAGSSTRARKVNLVIAVVLAISGLVMAFGAGLAWN